MSGGEAGATRLTASLAARARRGLLLIGLLAVLLSGVHLLWTHYQLRLAAMAGTLAMVAELSAENVDDTLQHHLAAVAVLGALAPVESDWPRYLGEVRTRFPAFVTMLVADARGDVLASVPALPAGSRRTWPTAPTSASRCATVARTSPMCFAGADMATSRSSRSARRCSMPRAAWPVSSRAPCSATTWCGSVPG